MTTRTISKFTPCFGDIVVSYCYSTQDPFSINDYFQLKTYLSLANCEYNIVLFFSFVTWCCHHHANLRFSYFNSQLGKRFLFYRYGKQPEQSLKKNFRKHNAFFSAGVIGVIWSVIWFLVIFDSPAQHPRISMEERNHIEMAIGNTINNKSVNKLDFSFYPLHLLFLFFLESMCKYFSESIDNHVQCELVLDFNILKSKFITHSRHKRES